MAGLRARQQGPQARLGPPSSRYDAAMSLSLRASAPPASSSTGSPQPVVRSLKAFSLYASPHEETAAMVAARRALMSRKSLSVEEANERARERRRAAS